MQTLSATNVAKNCGLYLDSVQRAPVIITKKNRPVAVTMSFEKAQELKEALIEMNIQNSLDDLNEGKYKVLTPEYSESILNRFSSKYKK